MLWNPEVVAKFAKFAQYSLGLATTALSVFTLTHETTMKNDDPTQPRRLTSAGRGYLLCFVGLAVMAFGIGVVGDSANTTVNNDAKAKAERAQSDAEKARRTQYDEDLSDALKQGVARYLAEIERGLSAQQAAINKTSAAIQSSQQKLLDETNTSAATLSKSFTDASQDATNKIQAQLKQTSDAATAQSNAIAQLQKAQAEQAETMHQSEVKTVIESAQEAQDANLQVGDVSYTLSLPGNAVSKDVPDYHWDQTLVAQTRGSQSQCPQTDTVVAIGSNGMTCNNLLKQLKANTQTHRFAEQLFHGTAFLTIFTIGSDFLLTDIFDEDCLSDNGKPHEGSPQPCLSQPSILPRQQSSTSPMHDLASTLSGEDGSIDLKTDNSDKYTRDYFDKSPRPVAMNVEPRSLTVSICYLLDPPNPQTIHDQILAFGQQLPESFDLEVTSFIAAASKQTKHDHHLVKPAQPDAPLPGMTGRDACVRWTYHP